MRVARYFNNEACPPGNSGICCTTVKTRPDVSTSLICLCTIREDVFFFPPESRKVTGTVYLTLTTLPRCFPGDHTGMEFITRKASSFSSGLTPRITSASEIAPSFPTTKEQLTRPSIPFLTADSGYLTFVARNFSRAPCPPGNSGITSTTVNTWLRARLAASIPSSDSTYSSRFSAGEASPTKGNGKIASGSKTSANVLSVSSSVIRANASTLLKISKAPTTGIKIKYFVLPMLRERFLFIMLIRFFRCSILKLLDKEVTDLLVCANPKR